MVSIANGICLVCCLVDGLAAGLVFPDSGTYTKTEFGFLVEDFNSIINQIHG